MCAESCKLRSTCFCCIVRGLRRRQATNPREAEQTAWPLLCNIAWWALEHKGKEDAAFYCARDTGRYCELAARLLRTSNQT